MVSRNDRLLDLLHRISDRFESSLESVFRRSVMDGFDTDDMRKAYGEWFGEDHLTRRYDAINEALGA